MPTFQHLAAMSVKRACVWTWSTPAEDLAAYLAYLAGRLPVMVTADIARRVGHDG